MGTLFGRIKNRALATGIPTLEEIERFGSGGEDVIYRMLREEFECVIRGVVVPHKGKYLEKDFLILHKGVPVVIEVKNWKGKIGYNAATGNFYQDKENGVHKELKSPVGTTRQYLQRMKDFYETEREAIGMVVFAEPDCTLNGLPDCMDGIRLVTAPRMISAINTAMREYGRELTPLTPSRILRCTRIYSTNSEFCKGVLADEQIPCFDANGKRVSLSTDHLRYLAVQPQPLLLRDRLLVTFTNGATGEFYNRDASLSLCCLDGSCCRIALCKVRHILF